MASSYPTGQCLSCRSAATGKNSRIGYLNPAFYAAYSTRIKAFRQGLRDLGYVEVENISIQYRHADGKLERLPDLAAELVQIKG